MSSPSKWTDVISAVERAYLEEGAELRQREKLINKKYVFDALQQMERQREEVESRRAEGLQERLRLEECSVRQYGNERKAREEKLHREREYTKNNLNLFQSQRRGEVIDKKYVHLENPFVKLLEEEEKRKDHFRQNLRKQNQINFLQEKIKLKELNESKLRQKEQREKYTNFIEAYYLKKAEDRNIFKNKYLKIPNPERPPFPTISSTIEKDYQSINKSMMNVMKQGKEREKELDQILSKINKNIEVPDSSPAFLGRIPINTDRKKQLQYIQRSAYRQRSRLKTDGDVPAKNGGEQDVHSIEGRRYTSNIQQLPALEKFYNRMSGHKLNRQQASRKTVNNMNDDKPQAKANYLPEPSKAKAYSTYDIIQNQKKIVYL